MKRLFVVPIIATLILALFPSAFVQAQGSKTGYVCFDQQTGDVKAPLTDGEFVVPCEDGYEYKNLQYQTTKLFICTYQYEQKIEGVGRSQSYWGVAAAQPTGVNATPDCSYLKNLSEDGITIKTINGPTALGTGTYTPGNPNPPTTGGPTPVTPKPPGNNQNPRPNPNNSTAPAGGQECETGFKAVGPLCMPEVTKSGTALINTDSVGALAASIIRILLYFAAIVAVIFIIIGGYYIMTARGNDTQFANGRKTLTNAIIGLIIIILSFVIVQAITGFILQ